VKNSKQFLGLGKTKYNSSVCLMNEHEDLLDAEVLLTERLNRKKCSGAWPEVALNSLEEKIDRKSIYLAENRDVHHPRLIEDIQDSLFPFYDYLKKKNLDFYTSKYNPNIEFVSHHLCHAYAALSMSPFYKSLIVVLDGAGSSQEYFPEIKNPEKEKYEECSVYLQEEGKLQLIYKRWINFNRSSAWPAHSFGNRTGALYEKASEFIFNSPNSSGKVMGLAAFGNARLDTIENPVLFQESLKWDQSFKGKSKKEWETSKNMEGFIQIAAEVQRNLEKDYSILLNDLKQKFPNIDNLILTGGCALNCTNNSKILSSKLFNKIYITPFPGDESIAFGLANYLYLSHSENSWKPLIFENQSAYFGAKSSAPTDQEVLKNFSTDQFVLEKHVNIEEVTAKHLQNNQIIAWFQGRSESGPRALGNRSILVRPDRLGIKDYLNAKIKFRESFRPYGCSVLHEKAHEYFEIEPGFDNPYMSYAIQIKPHWREALKDVGHIDGTSRMQSVRVGQNERFHKLIKAFGELSGVFCLLNTSLNVMDEPIVETVSDAKRFLENTPVDALVIDNFFIKMKNRA
jgi:carbamoyltransferase